MTRFANDIKDGQLGAATAAANSVSLATFQQNQAANPGRYTGVPIAYQAPPAVLVRAAPGGAAGGSLVPIRADTAALDIERLMGARRGSGGAGTSLVGPENPTPENLLAADSPESPPGETSAFPNIGFPGDEKEGKIEPKNLLIMAALAAMYLL